MSFYKRRPIGQTNQKVKDLTLNEAKKKLMDFVARRDHTEKELRKKLSHYCEEAVLEQVIQWAHQQKWLASPDKLKSQFADQLSRRGKGIRKINQKLKELGLETVKSNKEEEIEKAKKLVLAKWSAQDFKGLDFKDSQKLKAKIMRFLMTRGYETDVINFVMTNNLKTSNQSEFYNEEENYDEEF